MSVPLLQMIETGLAGHRPHRPWLRRLRKRSAVALILQVRDGELHILMIKRAEREGDPWSGHMAFPGGRMDKADANGFAVSLRETEEEVGLQLEPSDRCIGRLSDINARPSRGALGMIVSAFVFRLDRAVVLTPNYEVAEVVWVPLEFLLDSDNREEMVWKYKNVEIPMPCYFYEGRRIWGLSLMMLDELMDLVEGDNPRRKRWRKR
ncbi:CoA pyrophosphatase [Halioglobus sp. HI00S01]|uniref:NUDIX hydrolase n=1 Tax=Halioglobus sp. HI00S01 TaxID=1822214 RepID=UPI000AA93201|nr:CoA pyrophosphatase [Halioglobus sp. HI00S01]